MQGAFLGQLTDPQQLEKYTKEHLHHGVNSLAVFNNFKAYIQLSSDPHNIFRYMEEKAICTFLPEFWILKAEYLADCGDYEGCFECIEEAHSRNGICEEQAYFLNNNRERIVDVSKKEAELMAGLINQMKGFPLKSKRSVQEYSLLNGDKESNSKNQKKHHKILSIYRQKYGGLRREKERMAKTRRQKQIQSWLAEVYEIEEIQEKKIEEKIHENSVRLSKDIKHHSMHTPHKSRDPMRLTKTMDSVEILRRKRSTNEKSKRRNHVDSDSDDECEGMDWTRSKMVASVPVGKSFSNLKRRVTFEMFRDLKDKNGIDVEHQTKSEVSEESNKPAPKQESRMIDEGSNEIKSLPNPPTKLQ